MPSILQRLKNTKLAHRVLNHLLLRELRRAQRTADRGPLTAKPALYAVERRVLDHLAGAGPGSVLARSGAPAHILAGFELLREALVYLRDSAPAHTEARLWNSRLNALECKARVDRVRSYPPRGHVELTNRCTLRCPICPQSSVPESCERSTMSSESLDAVFPVLKWLDEVRLFGFGESLLHERFVDLLDAVPPQVQSLLITNGLLLTAENIRIVVDHGLKTLCVSVDGAKPETYARMRGVDALEKILANVGNVTAYRRERKSETPKVCLNFVATRSNIGELEEFIRRAKALGVDEVGVSYLTAFSEEFRGESLFYDQDRSDRLMEAAERAGRELGIQVWTPPRFAVDPAEPVCAEPASECLEPWLSINFRCDGHLAPCCTYDAKYAPWPSSGFFEAWNSPAFVSLRQNLGTPAQPERCRLCCNNLVNDHRKEQSHFAVPFVAADRPDVQTSMSPVEHG